MTISSAKQNGKQAETTSTGKIEKGLPLTVKSPYHYAKSGLIQK